MSFTKSSRPLILALCIFAVLYLLADRFLGPGLNDQSVPIAAGYEYDDAGGYEKAIVYRGSDLKHQIVIDARVDDYKIDGKNLLVARRPRVSELAEDGALDSRLLPTCEYWAVDMETHRVQQISSLTGLHCN